MKKSLLILSLLFGVFSQMWAGDRTEQQMKEAAAKALTSHVRRAASTSELKELKSLPKLKIFGYDEGGFAVVTTDDRFDEVIGYSSTKFSKGMPGGFKWWMEAVNEVMENGLVSAKTRSRSAARRSSGVGPLITTTWGQTQPYNNKCKITANGEEYYLLTGCVATAMAQVMNFYKYPTKGKGNNSYTINYKDIGSQTYSANFENSYYDWDNMLDDYSSYWFSDSEDKHTDAVSTLMSDCGIAVNMNYKTYSSGASPYNIPIAMKNYFSYSFLDDTKTIYFRDDYSNDDWMNIIYTALNNSHPILYGGYGGKGGHAFVIHGYDPNGYVFVNWGWDGNYDGYYMIDMLTPGIYSFNNNQDMIIPIPEGQVVETKYRLSYIVDGVVYKEYELKAGDVITPESAPTKEGYTFSGWSTIPQTMPAHDVTITGSLTKGAYKLTYMVDGGVYKTVNYDYGATIKPEAAPTKKGHTFSGWNQLPTSMPAYDVTVTGSFTINKYKLIYQVDGEDYKTYEVEYGANITPEAEPTREGYTFSGWNYIPSTMPDHDVTITGVFTDGSKSANTVTVNIDGIYYILIGKARTAEVTSSPNYYSGSIIIPETVEYEGFTYQVIQIGDKAFSGCYNMSSISIPASVSKIGKYAFQDCNKISSVVLPNSIQDIGEYAFLRCRNLSSITLSDGITVIPYNLFLGCSGLKSITIPASVVSIKSGAFYGCSALESVSLPSSITTIESSCFYGCESLSSIAIPEKVTAIEFSTFYGCTNLNSVTIGKSVSNVGSKALAECKSLESVVCMAENVPSAYSDAFENSYIENVILYVPDASVNSYKLFAPWNLFEAVKGVSEYDPDNQQPASQTALINGIYYILIGKSRTAEVTSSPNKYSGDITIPKSVEYGGFTYQVTQIGDKAFSGCYNMSSISISAGVSKIGKYAFQDCNKISSVVLPNSIQDIGEYAFLRCRNLSSVTLSDGITVIPDNLFLGCSGLKSITIPASVVSIKSGAFYGCSALESVSLPSSITTIESSCFNGCESLSSIAIPEKVTAIEFSTFYGCTNLNSVTIGKSVSNVGSKALAECKSLESVVCMAENVPSAYSDAFENSYIEHVTLYVPENSVDKYKAQEPWSKFGQIVGFSRNIKYTLTYKVDGAVYKTYQLEAGSTITPEPAPTKEGYTFSGWKDLPTTMPAYNVTVSGSFTVNKYKLTYMVDGVEYKSYQIEYGANITPEAAPTMTGYTFSGWSNIPSTMPAKDVTVTGTFKVNKYKLTYKVDGTVYKTYEIEYGASITPEAAPTKEGYTFSGWKDLPATMPANDVTVTGTFERVYNVGDVTNVVNCVMNANTGATELSLYDMNNDGELNIGDIILIVKWILNNAGNGGGSVRRRAGEIVDVRQYTAAQFEIELPSNAKVKNIKLVNSMKQSHQIMFNQLDEQTYAVVVYSLANQLIVPDHNNIVVVETEETDSESPTILNAIFAKPNGEIANYDGFFVSTGIEQSHQNDDNPAKRFDLRGNRLENGNSQKKGVYIINGKKVVVK